MAIEDTFRQALMEVWTSSWATYRRYGFLSRLNEGEQGLLVQAVLLLVYPEADRVIERVHKHIVCDSTVVSETGRKKDAAGEAWALKNSYSASLNMIAVAGAIVAQIAITALSLQYIEQTHWTVEAAFLISLVNGLLSVSFSCDLQIELGALHGPEETKEWLVVQDSKTLHERPSYSSAFMLVAPAQLLSWSLLSLFVGFGIYYGLVYTRDLSPLPGTGANLAVLLVFVIMSAMSWVNFWPLRLVKLYARVGAQPHEMLGSLHGAEAENRRAVASPTTHPARQNTHAAVESPKDSKMVYVATENLRGVIEALEASVTAQNAALQAQEALLKRYRDIELESA